nr:LOW QUALITY PROTEIN: peregrin-like [Cherax quadricarinatus]
MPRLGLGYDMDQFLDHCRMTKPPYECPHASCGRIYRSLAGIQHHMTTYDHENPPPNVVTPKSARKKNMKRPPSPLASQEPEPPSIPYSHDMKTVEFEVDGKLSRLSVYDPIEILSKEDYEASMPPIVEEPPPQEQARTPSIKPLPKTPTSKGPSSKTNVPSTPLPKTPLQKPPKARTNDKDRGVDVQRYTIEEKKSNKLPEASFRVIEDYYKNLPDAPPQPSNYYRFIEKSLEELDEEVEYDMDEEDRAWLQLMNDKRAVDELPPVQMETFELLMDRLEKESFFQVFLEPIDSISNIPPARWKLTCYICKQRGVGACIQCNKVNCYTAFHVTCAQQAGLHMKIDAVRETSVSGTSVTVRKAAYCDMHTPADSDARPQLDEIMDSAKKAAAKAASRQKMKKARKILAEKRSAAPIVSVPTIPADRPILPFYSGVVNSVPVIPCENIQKLAALVTMQKRSQFMHRLLAYWTLKRQSRNGVPLLRRLTTSHSRRNNRPLEDKVSSMKDKERIISEAEGLREEIKYWQRLRQDLERARLLCELIRKREKTKRELVKAKAEERKVQLAPFVHLLLQTIDLIQEKDQQMIFAEPVDLVEVHDYLDVVKHPMDLSTMRQKAQTHQYSDVDQFASDFELMIDNCLIYNAKETIFYRTAVKLRDQGGAIIRQLRRNVENIGFDLETGLLLPHRPKPLPEFSDNKILKEVDEALAADVDESLSLEEREKTLLELLDKANMLRHHIARIKRVKVIRREIGIVRRKLALNQSGSLCHKSSAEYYDSDDDSDKDDSDIDDSSVIDDEAEPGEPSRPSTPPSLPSPMVGSHLTHSPSMSSAQARACNVSLSTSLAAPRQQRMVGIKGTSKEEHKQKRIDSFFTRVSKTPQRILTDQQDPAPAIADEAKAAKPEKEDSAQETPKKRGPGRPPKRLRTLSGPSVSPPAKKLVSETVNATSPTKESSEDGPEEEPPSVPSSPSGVNRRTSVLFTKKAGALFKKPENSSPQKRISRQRRGSEGTQGTNSDAESPSLEKSAKSVRKKKTPSGNAKTGTLSFPEGISILDLSDTGTPPAKDSFKMYRQGGEIPPETDEDTHSESNSSLTDTEDDTASETDSDGGGSGSDSSIEGESPGSGHTGDQIPLEPLDLVWAKCRGYPWYPALIINPKMPKTGYFHNGVPIPVPPDEVLALANNYPSPMYLVLFFDNKRTWQWLPRFKLEPLGVDSTLDKAKLVESRKPAERKAVKKAYEKAILHRCRVTGENTGLSGESENEEAT